MNSDPRFSFDSQEYSRNDCCLSRVWLRLVVAKGHNPLATTRRDFFLDTKLKMGDNTIIANFFSYYEKQSILPTDEELQNMLAR